MSITRGAEIVDTDESTLRAAVLGACESSDQCQVIVEYDAERFNVLYASEETLGRYDDEDHMREHFGRLHQYVHLDFTEAELFTDDLLPAADRVEYFVTGTDFATLVRFYRPGQAAGLFIALDPDAPVDSVLEAVRGHLEG